MPERVEQLEAGAEREQRPAEREHVGVAAEEAEQRLGHGEEQERDEGAERAGQAERGAEAALRGGQVAGADVAPDQRGRRHREPRRLHERQREQRDEGLARRHRRIAHARDERGEHGERRHVEHPLAADREPGAQHAPQRRRARGGSARCRSAPGPRAAPPPRRGRARASTLRRPSRCPSPPRRAAGSRARRRSARSRARRSRGSRAPRRASACACRRRRGRTTPSRTRPSCRPGRAAGRAGTRARAPGAPARGRAPRARAARWRRRAPTRAPPPARARRARATPTRHRPLLVAGAVVLRHEGLHARRGADEDREQRPGPDVREADGGELGRAEAADHRGVDHAHQRGRHLRDDHRPGEAGDLAQPPARRGRGEGVGSSVGESRAGSRPGGVARCALRPSRGWSWLQLRSRRARPNRRCTADGARIRHGGADPHARAST